MTAKEAFERIKLALAKHLSEETGVSIEKHLDYIENDTDIMGVKQALTELEELKKRDTAMKWIDVEDNTGHYDKCPVCGYPSYNDLGHNHFCTVCGQRLDFEEYVSKGKRGK